MLNKYNAVMKNVLSIFLLLFLSNVILAQQPNDCVNALTVCGSGTFSSNASGIGNTQEINSCGGLESNSLWLEVHIVQAGTLGFNLIPNDPSILVDYDFWVFGPNALCGALGSPIRCATTNPDEAGLSTNLTGMNGTTLLTQTGPGSDGNGYVRWLNVLPGQSYYIAIDRPSGDGGFQLQWTGTATAGTGAFPIPPSANAIADVQTCSNTANVGIFNLDALAASINSNTTDNTITFYSTIANANDGINPLPNIYSNSSNPQTIYVRVTDNLSGCFSITDFDLVVNLVPNASISISSTSICNGDSITVTFTGTPNATFDYAIDAGSVQSAFLDASGSYTITESPTANRTYALTNVRVLDGLGNTVCSQNLNQSVSVTVNPLPTATISGATTICSGTTVITFNGTPNATVTYTMNSGANQTVVLNGMGSATVTTPLLTSNTTYNLVSVASSSTPVCSQNQAGSVLITVVALPTVTISGSTSVCSGSTTAIAFSGTPNATVTYTINGGTNQTIILNNTGSATLNTTTLTVNTNYALVGVAISGSGTCSQAQTGSALVTISPTPTATISGSTTICSDSTTVINFNGTPNATIAYTVNGGSDQTIVLDGTGVASLITPILITDTTYALVSATLTGTPTCTQTQMGSAIVTVKTLPTATISGPTAICSGNTAVITFNGTPNGTVTYTVDGGANQTITLNGTGSATLTTPTLTVNSTYALVSIASSGFPVCSKVLNGSTLITINAYPTATISETTTICSGTSTGITFNGTPNATVTYTINGGTNQTITLSGTGNATLTTPALTSNTTYALVGVISSGIAACSQPQIGTAVITVKALPTATISGTTTICSGTTAVISFNGTANATIAYTVDGGTNQTIVLSGTGTATITTPILIASSTYALVSIASSAVPICSQSQTGTAVITVNPMPIVMQPLVPYQACDDNADGKALFDLSNPTLTSMILGSNQLPTGYTISYYLTAANASTASAPLVSPYTNVTTVTQDIYIRVVNNATGCINATGILNLLVEDKAVATGPQTFSGCDNYGDLYDGVAVVDLTQYATAILNGQNPAVYVLSYYTSQSAAIAGVNALTPAAAAAYQTDPDTDTIWVKVKNSNNSIATLCDAITTINIRVERHPNPIINTINGYNTICVDFTNGIVVRTLTLDSGITNTGNYTFEWFEASNPGTLIGTGSTYTVNTAALGGATRYYTVHVTGTNNLSCDTRSSAFSVLQSGQASIPSGSTGYTVTNAFSAIQTITVLIDGYGTYEYSLDYGPRQPSNIFENVSPGSHFIHVWDVEGGCEALKIDGIQIIDYPRYFTPNDDGFHDTWNIVGSDKQQPAKIFIFDRYGKLLKQISSAGIGWDGTYNGHPLPSDDYWFNIEFLEKSITKQFRAHFTLKR